MANTPESIKNTRLKFSPGRNNLDHESSPYLKQHAGNPVWWQAWGKEAFKWAQEQDKPVFLSIGYATCHWCHVMEGDSFEKEDVAEILNRDFISIKVDREERPDVDAIHMAAVQGITGRGGWPLTVFLTPDGKPFWGTTFLPRAAFKKVLTDIAQMWRDDRNNILTGGEGLTGWLKSKHSSDHAIPGSDVLKSAGLDVIAKAVGEFGAQFDPVNGGFGTEPKFPPAMVLMFLLRSWDRTRDPSTREMVKTTLDRMARGGLHDHVGGGFHRYATDEAWLIPHFEKMLYDNALISLAFCESWQALSDDPSRDDFRHIATKTLDYALRDMRLAGGAFASAEDADSEKTEGKFYVWSWQDLEQLFPGEARQKFMELAGRYNLRPEGNFEFESHAAELEAAAGLKTLSGVNILHLSPAAKLQDDGVDRYLALLLKGRSVRVRPLRDDKVLAGWNGLMLGALARCGAAFGVDEYLNAARELALFTITHLRDADGSLLRMPVGNTRKHTAQLEDYAFVIWGLLEIYAATGEPRWLDAALNLQTWQDKCFLDAPAGNYHDAPASDETLIFRPKTLWDQATPSGNSVAATNLLRLARITLDGAFEAKAVKILASAWEDLASHPRAYPWMLMALDALMTGKNHVGGQDGTNYFCSIDGCEPPKNRNSGQDE
ncbi:thioredoxin domain-containing protein [bacterium]|nr:thioredoxin domain-containing protein [bacterium]